MFFAELVQPILRALRLLCYVVLLFYLFKVLVFIFRGKVIGSSETLSGHTHRLREAMALAYTGVAAYFIFHSISAVQSFTDKVLDAGTSVNSPVMMNQILVIAAGVICVAFICNFCRSLWMLKLLDHAVFEPVPNWEQLTNTTFKRAFEFITRATAALLFICLELQLEKLGSSTPEMAVVGGAKSYANLSTAGLFGLALYASLIAWWLSGRFIIKAGMPKSLLLFYIAGIFNSLFIFMYGGETVSNEWAWLLISIIFIMGLAAVYMVGVVLADLCGGMRNWLAPVKNRNGSDLANV